MLALLVLSILGTPQTTCTAVGLELQTADLHFVARGEQVELAPDPSWPQEETAVASADIVGVPDVVVVGGIAIQIRPADWLVEYEDQTHQIALPRGFRNEIPTVVAAETSGKAWIASPGHVGVLSAGDARLDARRLGARKVRPYGYVKGSGAFFISGEDVYSCSIPLSCERVGSLPFAPVQIFVGKRGYLAIGDGEDAGIYHGWQHDPLALRRLASGEVERACWSSRRVWASIREGEERKIALGSPDVAALWQRPLRTVITRSIMAEGRADVAAVIQVLEAAGAEQWDELNLLLRWAIADDRVAVRVAAAQASIRAPGVVGASALWLLGHDESAEVREQALIAAWRRCRTDLELRCELVLPSFFYDAVEAIAWGARDRLLQIDPRIALSGAPEEYKLDAVALLVAALHRDESSPAHRALQVLASDENPRVRAEALTALGAAEQ